MLVADILKAIDYLSKDHAEQEMLVKKARLLPCLLAFCRLSGLSS